MSRRGRGGRTLSGGARARFGAGAARRSSRRWTRCRVEPDGPVHRTPDIGAGDFRHRHQDQHSEDVLHRYSTHPPRPRRRPEPAAEVSARAGRVAAARGGAGAFVRLLGGGRQPAGGDRRPAEVLQELQVVGASALILLIFLLCVFLTSRPTGLSAVQRGMYLTSAVLAAVAAVLLVRAAYPGLVPGPARGAGQSRGKRHGGRWPGRGGCCRVGGGPAGGQVGRTLSGGRSARRGRGSPVHRRLVRLSLAAEPWQLAGPQRAAGRTSGTHPAQRRLATRIMGGDSRPPAASPVVQPACNREYLP